MIESFRLEKLGKIWRIRDCLVEARKVFWKAYHLLNFVLITKSAVCSRPIYDNWRPHSSVVSSDAAGLPIITLGFRPFSSHFKTVIQPWISFTCFVELRYGNQFGHGTTKLLWKQILRALHRGRFASLTISFFSIKQERNCHFMSFLLLNLQWIHYLHQDLIPLSHYLMILSCVQQCYFLHIRPHSASFWYWLILENRPDKDDISHLSSFKLLFMCMH